MSKALHMTGFLQRTPQRQRDNLSGGIGNKPLTEQELKWAKERREHKKAQEALQQTLSKLRAERQTSTTTLRDVVVTVRGKKQGTTGK